MGYKVPFVAPGIQYSIFRERILETIDRVLARGDLILRGDLREFEGQFAAYVGRKFAIGVGNGLDALHLALRASGISKGDEVITVAHTCIATVSAIVHAGAVPVLVDVGSDYNIDPSSCAAAITSSTKAIVPVHMNGRSCNMGDLGDLAARHNLVLIEDAAQGLGSRFRGKLAGTFGSAAAFSLYPFKMLGAFGDGGIVVTDDDKVAREVRLLRDYGEDRETGEILHFGFSSRLDNLQAAILSLKLSHLGGWIERRREIANKYRLGLGGIPHLDLPHYSGNDHFDVYLNYTVLTPLRDRLVEYLRSQGVEVLTPISFIKPLHLHAALGLKHSALQMTERVSREFLYLPIWPDLTDSQIEHVIDSVKDFFLKV